MRNGWIGFSALALLGACVMAEYDEEGRLNYVSPAAQAALPQGVDPAFLIRDENGCYGVALESGETVQGIALLNDQGVQVCDV